MLYTIREVANLLGVSKSTINRKIKEQKLKVIVKGNKYMIDDSGFDVLKAVTTPRENYDLHELVKKLQKENLELRLRLEKEGIKSAKIKEDQERPPAIHPKSI